WAWPPSCARRRPRRRGPGRERAQRANHEHSAVLGPQGRSLIARSPEGAPSERAQRANHEHSAVLGPQGRSLIARSPKGAPSERAQRANHEHSAVLGPQGRSLIARSPKGAPMSSSHRQERAAARLRSPVSALGAGPKVAGLVAFLVVVAVTPGSAPWALEAHALIAAARRDPAR